MVFKTTYREPDPEETIRNGGQARCTCGALHELYRYRKGFGYRCGPVVYSVVRLRESLLKVESERIDPPPVEEALW